MRFARRALAAMLLGLALAPGAFAQSSQPHAAGERNQQPPDVPAGDARIEGRVLQGEANRPVPKLEVVLYALAPDGTPGLRKTTSDANGAYAFTHVSSTANVAYLVGARYRDIPVPGGRITFAAGQKLASADIRVADLSSDLRNVHLRSQTLRLFREADGVRIDESFEIEQSGAEIAYVAKPDRARRPPGLRATLPASASDFRMPLGVIPEGLIRAGTSLRYFGPFYPGMQDLSFSYRLGGGELSPEGAHFRFAFTPAAGVERFSVLVPDGFSAFDAPQLASAGKAEDNGRSVTRFEAAHPSGSVVLSLVAPAARIDPSAISVPEVEIVLHADDAAISVRETHVLAVSGSALLLGTPETPLLRVPLPREANDVQFGSEAPGLAFAADANGDIALTGSLAPGEVPVQIEYRVPVGEAGARLVRSFSVKVPLLHIFVADTGRVTPSSPRLHRARAVRTEDLNYLSLEAFDVAPGEQVALALDPLPPRGGASPLAARGLAAAIGLALLAWLARPFVRREDGPADDAGASEPSRSEREGIYDAIRDLDHDFETAKLSPEDHTQLRDELRARAAELIRAEAGGAAATARADAPVCASCSAPAAPEHRFCASCGAPLGAPAA